jgi:hypothetical protein
MHTMHKTICSTWCITKVFVSCEFWVFEIPSLYLFGWNLGCYTSSTATLLHPSYSPKISPSRGMLHVWEVTSNVAPKEPWKTRRLAPIGLVKTSSWKYASTFIFYLKSIRFTHGGGEALTWHKSRERETWQRHTSTRASHHRWTVLDGDTCLP